MIHVGTSGYVYDHWRHVFYPKGLPARRWLEKLPRKGLRYAVEFRSASWYSEEICSVLDAHGAAFCEHDHFGHAIRDAHDLSDRLGDRIHCTDAVRDARGARPAPLE